MTSKAHEEKASSTTSSIVTTLTDLLTGGLAATIAKTTSTPFERIQYDWSTYSRDIYRLKNLHPQMNISVLSFTQYLGQELRNEGLSSLWRGNIANMDRYAPAQALNFAFKDLFRTGCTNYTQNPSWKWYRDNIIAGSAAGIASLFFIRPFETARVVWHNDLIEYKKNKFVGGRQFSYPLKYTEVWKNMYSSSGISGLYRGFGPASAVAAVYRGIYFGVYDSLKPILLSGESFFGSFVLGWAVTIGAGFASSPFSEVLKHRMMHHEAEYKNFFVTFKNIAKTKGPRSLFPAYHFALGLSGALTLACYDKLKSKFSGKILDTN